MGGEGHDGHIIGQENVSLKVFTTTIERTNSVVEQDRTSTSILDGNSLVESAFILVFLVLLLLGINITCM